MTRPSLARVKRTRYEFKTRAMSLMPQPVAPPIRSDETGGALRVGNSRVLLELVVRAFHDRATPEVIVQRYPRPVFCRAH
jgi:hypothetical protein